MRGLSAAAGPAAPDVSYGDFVTKHGPAPLPTLPREHDLPERLGAPWRDVVLVCRQCQKRGNGPKVLKAKPVAAALRAALKHAPQRPRVVLTNCLGLCPRGALAVVAPSAAQGAGAYAARSEAQAVAAVTAHAAGQ